MIIPKPISFFRKRNVVTEFTEIFFVFHTVAISALIHVYWLNIRPKTWRITFLLYPAPLNTNHPTPSPTLNELLLLPPWHVLPSVGHRHESVYYCVSLPCYVRHPCARLARTLPSQQLSLPPDPPRRGADGRHRDRRRRRRGPYGGKARWGRGRAVQLAH